MSVSLGVELYGFPGRGRTLSGTGMAVATPVPRRLGGRLTALAKLVLSAADYYVYAQVSVRSDEIPLSRQVTA